MKTLFTNARILDVKNGVINLGDVEVVDGIISNVGTFDIANDYDRTIDCKGNILMPGFVDTHCHTPMTLLRSFSDDKDLNNWLFGDIIPAEAKLTPEDIYWGEYLGILEYVRAGITTIEEGYFFNSPIYDAIKKSGIRARIGFGPTTRDVGMTNAEYLKQESSVIIPTDLIKPVCFVHSIYTSTEKMVSESVEFAKANNVPVSIHLAETKKEVVDSLEKNKKTPTKYLDDLNYFDTDCLCYHSIHLNEEDIRIIKEKNVSVSTCASSNVKLASGIAPIHTYLENGINVTIGTDGTASNNSLDMFKEMFLVATLSKVDLERADVVPAIDVLRMATLNGAKALGFNSGEIAVGKNADIILIDINQPHYQPQHNLISHLVYAGKSSDVYLTMIAGKIVYENGKYDVGEDVSTIYEKANAIRNELYTR
jgi:5-methylthioadenosine/S-adenosylhomocysteine deaminase